MISPVMALVNRRSDHPSPYPLPQGEGAWSFLNLAPFPDGEAVEREGVGGGV